jgi:large subunit ribosomal protein L5
MPKVSTTGLKKEYLEKIRPLMAKDMGLKNQLAVPGVTKVVINIGIGEGTSDKGVLEKPSQVLAVITGQKPKVARARISEAGFRLRAGAPIGLVVTLRGQRMYDFLEKLFRVVLPRLRDFQGVSLKSFDGQGNYSLGIPEFTVFPEVDYAKTDKAWGLEVTIVTNTGKDLESKRLLELMGMPFEKKKQGS